MYTYDQLKDGVKTLQQLEEEQKGFKSELGQIKSRDPQTKSSTQLDTIKMFKIFMIWDKKWFIYSMIIQKLNLKPFTNEIKKPKEQDLKY